MVARALRDRRNPHLVIYFGIYSLIFGYTICCTFKPSPH
jgi:hypothetical protein